MKQLKKGIALLVLMVQLLVTVSAFALTFEDGVHFGFYTEPKRGNKTVVAFTTKDNKITDFKFKEYTSDGFEKDENYGKTASEEAYKLAQASLEGAKGYPEAIVAAGTVEIDAVAGATQTLDRIKLAVRIAAGEEVQKKYSGEYVDERGQKTTVNFITEDGKIVKFAFVAYDKDGNEKGEEYGKGGSEDAYKMAQASLEASKGYPEAIVAAGDIDKVDAIAGATGTLDAIKEAVKDAFAKAN